MTITEHLEFSVVSAPLAQIDRRALSQSWYSALYGANGATPKSASERAKVSEPAALTRVARSSEKPASEKAAALPVNRRALGSSPLRTGAAEIDRRAARSPLARNIERRFLRPGAPVQAASFALEGERGRVRILLRNAGEQLQLVAICAPSARSCVATALAQARYALAMRCIALRTDVREACA